jgi:hypothetical protein
VIAVVLPSASHAASPRFSGSIVFIKSGNVWLTSPDGAHPRRLTRGGGRSNPSQSDSGTIVAMRRRALVRLTRRGRDRRLARGNEPFWGPKPVGARR